MSDRYFAGAFDADGLFYVFDRGDQGHDVAGPFDEYDDALVLAIVLNEEREEDHDDGS